MKEKINDDSYFINSALTDFKFYGIEIDYINSVAIVKVFNEEIKQDLLLYLSNFLSIEFSKKNKWGPGIYTCASDVIYKDSIKEYKIYLNSGDVCTITCKK